MDKTKQYIYKMLTENTGRAICDSGDAYGRNWEKNAGKTLEDFEKSPEAWISIDKYGDNYSFIPTASVFHALTKTLETDVLSAYFNDLPVNDWDSDLFYGVSAHGEQWLHDNGFTPKEKRGGIGGFNSYNWDCSLSQVIQGDFLEHESGDSYVLIQIHGGCDVRGGYTDAKLFKMRQFIEDWQIFADSLLFSIEGENIDFLGNELVNGEGFSIDQDFINELGARCTQSVYYGDILI